MKYLKKFNEAIVEWETDNIKNFYKELKNKLNFTKSISFDFIAREGKKHNIEIVDYETFLKDLPTEKMRKDAPSRRIPMFALVNPNTNKIRLVMNVPHMDIEMLDFAYHVMKHENVHVGQRKSKSPGAPAEFLGDIRNSKKYFSNKDEVMAFAQSISDQIMNPKVPQTIEGAMDMLDKIGLYQYIKSTVDEKTLNRYKKYIYLYLEKEFKKKNNL